MIQITLDFFGGQLQVLGCHDIDREIQLFADFDDIPKIRPVAAELRQVVLDREDGHDGLGFACKLTHPFSLLRNLLKYRQCSRM
ncbi:hypothetical protein D1872_319390 [compost metagenome]